MVNIAIIGCGAIVKHRHAPECRDNENTNIAGFFDINLERAQSFADEYGGKAYATYEEVLEDESVDAVIICTANKFHCEMTKKAFEHGKHVLCEKPMAFSTDEAKEMIAASEKSGKYLMMAHNQRLDNVSRKAKEILDGGKLGKVISFRGSFTTAGPDGWSADPGKNTWFFDKAKAGHGALGDLGVHIIDLISYLLGEDFARVGAFAKTLVKRGSDGELIQNDDTTICIFETKSGKIGSVEAMWTNFGEGHDITVLNCENGVMIIDTFAATVTLQMQDGTTEEIAVDGSNTMVSYTFADCILKGVKPTSDGYVGLKTLEILQKCLEASREGKILEI